MITNNNSSSSSSSSSTAVGGAAEQGRGAAQQQEAQPSTTTTTTTTAGYRFTEVLTADYISTLKFDLGPGVENENFSYAEWGTQFMSLIAADPNSSDDIKSIAFRRVWNHIRLGLPKKPNNTKNSNSYATKHLLAILAEVDMPIVEKMVLPTDVFTEQTRSPLYHKQFKTLKDLAPKKKQNILRTLELRFHPDTAHWKEVFDKLEPVIRRAHGAAATVSEALQAQGNVISDTGTVSVNRAALAAMAYVDAEFQELFKQAERGPTNHNHARQEAVDILNTEAGRTAYKQQKRNELCVAVNAKAPTYSNEFAATSFAWIDLSDDNRSHTRTTPLASVHPELGSFHNGQELYDMITNLRNAKAVVDRKINRFQQARALQRNRNKRRLDSLVADQDSLSDNIWEVVRTIGGVSGGSSNGNSNNPTSVVQRVDNVIRGIQVHAVLGVEELFTRCGVSEDGVTAMIQKLRLRVSDPNAIKTFVTGSLMLLQEGGTRRLSEETDCSVFEAASISVELCRLEQVGERVVPAAAPGRLSTAVTNSTRRISVAQSTGQGQTTCSSSSSSSSSISSSSSSSSSSSARRGGNGNSLLLSEGTDDEENGDNNNSAGLPRFGGNHDVDAQ